MTTDFQKRDTTSGQPIQRPRFTVGDKVTIRKQGSQHTVWKVSEIIPATVLRQTGYWLQAGNGHCRAVDEDRLTMAGAE